LPNPEVAPRAERRQFSVEYKLRILKEADHCTQRGEIGALLRREGLYSSSLDKWRTARARGRLNAEADQKRGRKSKDPKDVEIERLRRENEELRARLEKAELIIDVQKKLSLLLGLTPDGTESDEDR
jgi:transposase-like protein